MKPLRSIGIVCLCMMAVPATTQAKKTITIKQDCSADDMQVSHDQAKKEKIVWKAEQPDHTYIVTFKNNLSPCSAEDKAGTQLLTVHVPANDESDVCVARKKTREGRYPYYVYQYDETNKVWNQCADPAVIVTDGTAGGAGQPGSTGTKKKTPPKK